MNFKEKDGDKFRKAMGIGGAEGRKGKNDRINQILRKYIGFK